MAISFPTLAAGEVADAKAIGTRRVVEVCRFFRVVVFTLNLDGGIQFIYL